MRIMAIIITADLQVFQEIFMTGREERPISVLKPASTGNTTLKKVGGIRLALFLRIVIVKINRQVLV
jgi:hypothetical protein